MQYEKYVKPGFYWVILIGIQITINCKNKSLLYYHPNDIYKIYWNIAFQDSIMMNIQRRSTIYWYIINKLHLGMKVQWRLVQANKSTAPMAKDQWYMT